MSDANAERGEHQLVLAGTSYRARPSFTAIVAIEKKTGKSTLDLLRQVSVGDLFYTETGIVAAELIKAGAEDDLTRRVSAERIAELVFEEGLSRVFPTITMLLTSVVNGGRVASGEAKAPAAAPETGKAAGAE